jgi:hypothetical protein
VGSDKVGVGSGKADGSLCRVFLGGGVNPGGVRGVRAATSWAWVQVGPMAACQRLGVCLVCAPVGGGGCESICAPLQSVVRLVLSLLAAAI